MFNSSSSITQQVALAAWNDNINDEYWKLVKSIASDANWSLQFTDDTYKFVNQFGVETSPRTDILNQVRANSIISLKGTLDKNSSWHRASTSFWNNFKLNPFHQRLLFAHLQKSEILTSRGGSNKPYPLCHICNTPATWSHVFSTCSMCTPEITHLYSKWDEISSSTNMPHVRLPPDHSYNYINMDWNGVIQFSSNIPPLPVNWCNDIYCTFATFVGSCYKNCTWNSSSTLRSARNYQIKPHTDSYQTAWDRANLPSQPANFLPIPNYNNLTNNTSI